MNEIIGELSNIEESTSGIIEAANAKKKNWPPKWIKRQNFGTRNWQSKHSKRFKNSAQRCKTPLAKILQSKKQNLKLN